MSKLNRQVKLNHLLRGFARCLCVLIITIITPGDAQSANQDTQGIRVREMMPINFGRFTVERGSGFVSVDARSGGCNPHNAVMIRAMCDRGQFEIYGVPQSRVLVQVTSGATQGGAVLDQITTYPADGVVTLGANGIGYIYIGGRIGISQQRQTQDLQTYYHLEVNYLP